MNELEIKLQNRIIDYNKLSIEILRQLGANVANTTKGLVYTIKDKRNVIEPDVTYNIDNALMLLQIFTVNNIRISTKHTNDGWFTRVKVKDGNKEIVRENYKQHMHYSIACAICAVALAINDLGE
jgi:hypothetical protein